MSTEPHLHRIYRDASGKIGTFRSVETRPYYCVKEVLVSTDKGNTWMENESMELINVMSNEGVALEPGCMYKFSFDVYPYSRVKSMVASGPVLDVVGRDLYKNCFVVNPKEKYEVFGSKACAKFVVRTKEVKLDSSNLCIIPAFDVYSPDIDPDVETLESKIRDLTTDMKLHLPVEHGEPVIFDVHSFVLRSSTDFFDVAKAFKDDTQITLNPKYSVQAWSAVVDYMYNPVIACTNIGIIQEMMQIGDEYHIRFLVISGARRIRDFVEDAVTHNAVPWVVSIISMACWFIARHDPSYENDMVELCKSSVFLVHSKAHDLLQDLNFLQAYSEIIPSIREVERLLDSRNAGLVEYDRKPLQILGKRKWDD